MPVVLLNISAKMCSDEPGPLDPKFSAPGCALASAASSRRSAAGVFGEPAMTNCVEITIDTGTKSFTGSNGSLPYSAGALDIALVCSRMV
jgi:hypothetical protein